MFTEFFEALRHIYGLVGPAGAGIAAIFLIAGSMASTAVNRFAHGNRPWWLLAGSILVINVVLGRSLLGSVLFALAIAVGLTPQLLPAIVTISLSSGAKRLAHRKVVVKRLVSIEDLGNIVVLFTDKTGTLTEGQITFAAALDTDGRASDAVLRAGLLCNDASCCPPEGRSYDPGSHPAAAVLTKAGLAAHPDRESPAETAPACSCIGPRPARRRGRPSPTPRRHRS